MKIKLKELGFDNHFTSLLSKYGKKTISIARVTKGHKKFYTIFDGQKEYLARASGNLRHKTKIKSELPVVGDFVVFSLSKDGDACYINEVLKRKNMLFRKSAAKKSDIQVMAANIDYCFIMVALDREINHNAIGRYLSMVITSSIKPIVVLTKSDLCEEEDTDYEINEIKDKFKIGRVFATSIIDGSGIDIFDKYLKKSKTSIFIGASGAGKSSVVNYIIGDEVQAVSEVREYDDKGMHTTTSRQLFILKNGGIIIDTPGIRSIGMWEDNSALKITFSDIEEHAEYCKFNNCTHQHEPECRVIEMVEKGEISAEHYHSYITLINETETLAKQNQIDIKKDKRDSIKKVIDK